MDLAEGQLIYFGSYTGGTAQFSSAQVTTDANKPNNDISLRIRMNVDVKHLNVYSDC